MEGSRSYGCLRVRGSRCVQRWQNMARTSTRADSATESNFSSSSAATREDFKGIERHACPGFGVCGAQFTANTMATAAAALGVSLLDSPLRLVLVAAGNAQKTIHLMATPSDLDASGDFLARGKRVPHALG